MHRLRDVATDDEIRAYLAAAGEAQWAALPPEYQTEAWRSRGWKVVTRRDDAPLDDEVGAWLAANGGLRVLGVPLRSQATGHVIQPVLYLALRSALEPAES